MWKKRVLVFLFTAGLRSLFLPSFLSSTLPCFSSEYINIWKCWLGTKKRKTHGLNKVHSDFRVWDLQINPAWVSWGPGSGINCYISWPSSCCLSQPAWLGPRLARNHGLRPQQCRHFPRRKKTQAWGVYWANKMSTAKHFSLPHFTITFYIAIFPSCLLLVHWALRS